MAYLSIQTLAIYPVLLYNLLEMNTKIIQLGFVLGRDYALSVAEIFALISRLGGNARTLHYAKDILIIEPEMPEGQTISIANLGGTIKIFEIMGEMADISELKAKVSELIPVDSQKRINFGISSYGPLSKKVILNLGYEIKEQIVASGYSARFVTGKSVDLSSVIVHENKLIERGFEAIVVRTNSSYILGRTIEVQNYKLYSKRDFGRPQRDDRNGMLPPKLAQIMINLAEAPQGSTLYDPFCGSGTTLQEALLLGYEDIYGSDLSERNIADTKTNLDWLSTSSVLESNALRVAASKIAQDDERTFVSDVLNPSKMVEADAIVGEGFLGEPYRRSKDQAVHDTEELTKFYIPALVNLSKQLKPGGRLVIAIPFFIVGPEYFYLPIIEKLADVDLELISPNIGEAELKLYGRGNLTYSRADQFVGRELLILKKG